MLIKKDGIYRNIDPKEFGIFQSMGFEKVVTEPIKEEIIVEEQVVEFEPVIDEVVKPEEELEPIDENKLGETNVEPEPVVDELPKSKKKKK